MSGRVGGLMDGWVSEASMSGRVMADDGWMMDGRMDRWMAR